MMHNYPHQRPVLITVAEQLYAALAQLTAAYRAERNSLHAAVSLDDGQTIPDAGDAQDIAEMDGKLALADGALIAARVNVPELEAAAEHTAASETAIRANELAEHRALRRLLQPDVLWDPALDGSPVLWQFEDDGLVCHAEDLTFDGDAPVEVSFPAAYLLPDWTVRFTPHRDDDGVITEVTWDLVGPADGSDPGQREPLAEGREHLTVSGRFQSDRFPTVPAGKVPLSDRDPQALPALVLYAELHAAAGKHGDGAFVADLIEALCRQHGAGAVALTRQRLAVALEAVEGADLDSYPHPVAGGRLISETIAVAAEREAAEAPA